MQGFGGPSPSAWGHPWLSRAMTLSQLSGTCIPSTTCVCVFSQTTVPCSLPRFVTQAGKVPQTANPREKTAVRSASSRKETALSPGPLPPDTWPSRKEVTSPWLSRVPTFACCMSAFLLPATRPQPFIALIILTHGWAEGTQCCLRTDSALHKTRGHSRDTSGTTP